MPDPNLAFIETISANYPALKRNDDASAVWATSASMRYMPAPSSATGRLAPPPCAAAEKAAAHRTEAIEERRTEERFFIAEQARKSMEVASLARAEE